MGSLQGKIFGIGLSKTGTSSLAQALQILGFRTRDNMGTTRYTSGDLSSIDMATVEAHDALTDTPIPSFYRELDRRFPNSRFILTVREREGWLKSCRKQFNARFAAGQSEPNKRLFEDLYGTNEFDETNFAAGYERFVAGVFQYFRDRPGDLLILDVAAGEGWEKLCPFLGRPVPDVPFPKANVTQIRWMKMEDLVAVAQAAGRELLLHFGGEVPKAVRHEIDLGRPAGRRLLDHIARVALGRGSAEAAVNCAHRVLVAGLRGLNPEIPILSPVETPQGYADRKRWNHVWLVSPLDGEAAFLRGSPRFSVNIALIEDGRPIYGVVHAPAAEVTYFGRIGKGAFKRGPQGNELSLPLWLTGAGSAAQRVDMPAADDVGVALAICGWLDHWDGQSPKIAPTMEWNVAAAHAVLGAAGMRLLDRESAAHFLYNKRTLATACGVVRAS